MVVSIILSILKIIGITLLCILGLILFVLSVVLFVPIRYRVTADSNINENEKDYHVRVKVSWLLWLVHGKYEYPGEDGFILKVGPFTVYGKKKKEKRVSKNKTVATPAEEGIKENTTLEELPKQNVSNSENVLGETLEAVVEEEKEKNQKGSTLKEKILYTRQKIYDKIKNIWQKIKNIVKNVKKYIGILQSEEFKEAFALCKDSLVRLFCMIKPRKVKIKAIAGLGSPDKTGYMCAAIGVVSPYFKNQIHVMPDFENFVLEGNAVVKGRVYLFVVIIIGIKLFFDKNIRNVTEMFRKEEV